MCTIRFVPYVESNLNSWRKFTQASLIKEVNSMKRKIIHTSLIAIYTLSVANIIYPVIRFENRMFSLFYAGVIMLIPIYLAIRSFGIKNRVLKAASVLSTCLLSSFSILVLAILFFMIGNQDDMGYDPSFEWDKEIVVDEYTIDTYRINGGAMTSYSVLVRQEKPIGLGLKLVKNIYQKDGVGDFDIEWNNHVVELDGKKIQLKVSIY